MAVQAAWMRKNMLGTPGSEHSWNKRQMSEMEIRALRSTENMSKPDWYVNKTSPPPKIIANNIPMDQRPSVWKNLRSKRSMLTVKTIVLAGNSIDSRHAVPKTEMLPLSNANRSFATHKIRQHSPMKRSPASRIRDSLPKNRKIDFSKFSTNSKHPMMMNLDATETPLPVLATSKDSSDGKINTKINEKHGDDSNFHAKILNDSLIDEKPRNQKLMRTELKFQIQPRVNFPTLESFEQRANSAPGESPVKQNQRSSTITSVFIDTLGDDAKQEQKLPSTSSVVTFDPKSDEKSGEKEQEESSKPASPAYNANLQAKSGEKDSNKPKKSSISMYINAFEKMSSKEIQKPSTFSSLTISNNKKKSSTPIENTKSKPISSHKKAFDVTSKVNNGNTYRVVHSRVKQTFLPSNSRETVHFRKKRLLTPILERSYSSLPPSPDCSSKNDDKNLSDISLNSLKKLSTSRERIIIKNKQHTRPNKTLRADVIEEFNKRCRISSQSTYVNFVKEVVKSLENDVLNGLQRRNVITEANNCKNDGEKSVKNEIKSVALRKTKTFKVTDNRRNGISRDMESIVFDDDCNKYEKRLNIGNNVDKDVNKNNNDDEMENKNYVETIEHSPMSINNDDDDWLYWNQKKRSNFPRASSFLSINSRLNSSNITHNTSPCISPIDDQSTDELNDRKTFSKIRRGIFSRKTDWGTIYRTNRSHNNEKCLFNETMILDSGYSDRWSSRSQRSSYTNENVIKGYTKNTKTGDNDDSCYSEISNDLKLSHTFKVKAQIHAPPFVI